MREAARPSSGSGPQIAPGYEQFKAEKQVKEVADLAQAHGLTTESLAAFKGSVTACWLVISCRQLERTRAYSRCSMRWRFPDVPLTCIAFSNAPTICCQQ